MSKVPLDTPEQNKPLGGMSVPNHLKLRADIEKWMAVVAEARHPIEHLYLS